VNGLFPAQASGVGVRKNRTGLDFYRTPEWAIRALLEKESISGRVWEPCCGDGAISKVLTERGIDVFSSDIEARGFGSKIDFLRERGPFEPDAIITNPPYFCVDRCVARAIELTKARRGKVAFLMRLAYLEGQRRYRFFQETPPARVWVFSKRVEFIPGGRSAMSMAWFVWDHRSTEAPLLGWIGGAQ
jgi:hypothetical protein